MTTNTITKSPYEYINSSTTVFKDVYDLTYNLLNAIDLFIDNSGIIVRQNDRQPLLYFDYRLKATTNPSTPCYAGQGEILFDILNNVYLVNTLFGAVLTKAANDHTFMSLSHWIEDIPNSKLTALSIKDTDYNVYTTRYYNNKCLKFIEAIFLIYGDKVDLSNFDKDTEE